MKRPLTRASDVLAACDAALARTVDAAVPVVAFDADHTLWNADVGDLGWHGIVNDERIRPEAREAIAAELAEAAAKTTGSVHDDARLLYELYKQDKVSELSIVRAMTVCYAGWKVDELRVYARRIAREVLHPSLYEGIPEIARGLRERGLRVVVVSGSPTLLVSEGVRGVLPVDPEKDVFGTELDMANGVLGATMRAPVTFFDGKVQALEIQFPKRRPSFAFGDSKGDVPLLHHAARLAFAVNPRPQLRRLAEERESFFVFEPPRTVSGTPVRTPGTDRVIE